MGTMSTPEQIEAGAPSRHQIVDAEAPSHQPRAAPMPYWADQIHAWPMPRWADWGRAWLMPRQADWGHALTVAAPLIGDSLPHLRRGSQPPEIGAPAWPRLRLREWFQRRSRSRPELLLAARSSTLKLLLINPALPRCHTEQIEAVLDRCCTEQIEAALSRSRSCFDRRRAIDRRVSPHLHRGSQPPEIGALTSRPHHQASSMGGTEGRAPNPERAHDLASMGILNIV
jgi:hypothetical protein